MPLISGFDLDWSPDVRDERIERPVTCSERLDPGAEAAVRPYAA